jgi:hypothetical protein
MKPITIRTAAFATLAIVSSLILGLSNAQGLQANLDFPDGLPAGKEVRVLASFNGDTSGLKGVPVAAVYETGQDSESIQIELGKIGEELQGKLTPRAGAAKLTFRFSGNGKNYAQVAELNPEDPNQPTGIQYDFDQAAPSSRTTTPALPVSIWIVGALALGFYALRGKKAAF